MEGIRERNVRKSGGTVGDEGSSVTMEYMLPTPGPSIGTALFTAAPLPSHPPASGGCAV